MVHMSVLFWALISYKSHTLPKDRSQASPRPTQTDTSKDNCRHAGSSPKPRQVPEMSAKLRLLWTFGCPSSVCRLIRRNCVPFSHRSSASVRWSPAIGKTCRQTDRAASRSSTRYVFCATTTHVVFKKWCGPLERK